MIVDWVLFIGLALVAIASALGMLFSRDAIHSALSLVINFVSVAAFYLLLGAPFIALVQVTVYAGAIMVLFLFVIMLLGAERLRKGEDLPWQQPLSIVLSGILLVEIAYILFFRPATFAQQGAISPNFSSTPLDIGEKLFSSYLLPFEIISVLLLVAMVGAIVLTKRRRLQE